MRPAAAERETISRIIMDELVYGMFRPEGVEYFQSVIQGLKGAGCDAVILGCTELPLAVPEPVFEDVPLVDSTATLARALIAASTSTRSARSSPHRG